MNESGYSVGDPHPSAVDLDRLRTEGRFDDLVAALAAVATPREPGQAPDAAPVATPRPAGWERDPGIGSDAPGPAQLELRGTLPIAQWLLGAVIGVSPAWFRVQAAHPAPSASFRRAADLQAELVPLFETDAAVAAVAPDMLRVEAWQAEHHAAQAEGRRLVPLRFDRRSYRVDARPGSPVWAYAAQIGVRTIDAAPAPLAPPRSYQAATRASELETLPAPTADELEAFAVQPRPLGACVAVALGVAPDALREALHGANVRRVAGVPADATDVAAETAQAYLQGATERAENALQGLIPEIAEQEEAARWRRVEEIRRISGSDQGQRPDPLASPRERRLRMVDPRTTFAWLAIDLDLPVATVLPAPAPGSEQREPTAEQQRNVERDASGWAGFATRARPFMREQIRVDPPIDGRAGSIYSQIQQARRA